MNSKPSGDPGGFALVVTITLLVLLALVAVGLLTLSTVVVRSGQSGTLQAEARANARLALLLALGDLQRLAGPDQRVTASSGLFDSKAGTRDYDGLEEAHWTGVWRSWQWDGQGASPDYDKVKKERFLGWLVSHPDREALVDPTLPSSGPGGEAILLHDGLETDPAASLRARAVRIAGHSATNGRYAWAVLDEGQKAPVRLPDIDPEDRAAELARLVAPPAPSFESIGDLEALANGGNKQRQKLLSTAQMEVAGVREARRYFHDLTPYSASLLTNVVDGGMARDLRTLFEGDLPKDYAARFLYSDVDRPLAKAPSRFRGNGLPFPHPDPSWRLLQSHYSQYRKVANASTTPTVKATFLKRPPPGRDPDRAAKDPYFHTQKLVPVIAKAQFVFSISAGWHGHLNTLRNRGAATAEDKYISWLVTDPVITLWNPYNVTLRIDGMQVELHRVPLAFQVYKNGRLVNARPTHFANTFLGGDIGSRSGKYYNLALRPEYGAREITLKPGEFKVFTAHNHVKHYRHQYSKPYDPRLGDTNKKQGLILRPGFNAPAGNRSNRYVGGVSTLNVLVNDDGSDGGLINGKRARSVPLRPNDRIEIAVFPKRAKIDRFREHGNKEITAYLKYFLAEGASGNRIRLAEIGGVEFDFDGDLDDDLESYGRRDLTTFIVPRAIPQNVKADDYEGSRPPPAVRFKEPFLIASLQLKTEQDSKFPSRSWIHNGPANLFASAGLDQREGFAAHQYEFTWEPMTDWTSSPTVEIDPANRGFGASGIYAQTGREFSPMRGIPLTPASSLAELRHAPLNTGGQLPLTSQVVGNSFAEPLLGRDKIMAAAGGGRTYLDHSYLANQALFDRYFFSTITARDTALHGSRSTYGKTLKTFLETGSPLPNPRFRPYPGGDPAAVAAALESEPDGYRKIAGHLLLEGGFNVNSTSVDAWRAVLSGASRKDIPLLNALTGRLESLAGDAAAYDGGAVFSRFTPPARPSLESANGPDQTEILKWAGYRRLRNDEIRQLAEAIVEQVKLRGPFQSLAEFVNRRVENSDLGLHGALQAAIDSTDLNREFAATSVPVPPDPAYADPAAAAGLSAEGAPAFLNQADLLTPLAPHLTVRSDTFLIRTYGEATDRAGNKAVAICEAVVQRVPQYLDAAEADHLGAQDLQPDGINARFGRRFRLVSFRWVSGREI